MRLIDEGGSRLAMTEASRLATQAHPDVPALLIQGARKDYGRAAGGRRDAVADVSISVSRGAIHGLLGPNGAGKTTTLKMLMGLVRPSAGTFEILGRPATAPGARARLGFLPEQPYFPNQLTAAEVMTLYGRLTGVSRAELAEQTAELLDRVGLDGRQKTPLSKFSRGMLQRLGLAQALLGSPELLILDEPASGLDPIGQRDIRNLMLEFKAAGATILLSSHQLSEVETVSDEVTILDKGRVAARGHIDDLLGVAGETAVKVRGQGDLPSEVTAVATGVVVAGNRTSFSIPDAYVRSAIDQLDDAGWRLISLAPQRASLEDYFARLVDETGGSHAESAVPGSQGGDAR